MFAKIIIAVALAASAAAQDPCADCTEAHSIRYQGCVAAHGDPCTELGSDGLLSKGPGKKRDMHCCTIKAKHDRCLQCANKDCEYNSCTVNKMYYNQWQK